MKSKRDHSIGRYWDECANVVTGCTPVSRGCDNCWAKKMAARGLPMLRGKGNAKVPFETVLCHEERLDKIRNAKPGTIMPVTFLGDLFHEDVPAKFIHDVYEAMQDNEKAIFLVLTKRPARMRDFLCEIFSIEMSVIEYGNFCFPDNIWWGVSIEDQDSYNKRMSTLMHCCCEQKFVSFEPLIEAIDFNEVDAYGAVINTKYLEYSTSFGETVFNYLKWVIAGAETKAGKRPADNNWFRSLRDQCKENNVPFYLKQLTDGSRVLDAKTHSEMPKGVEA